MQHVSTLKCLTGPTQQVTQQDHIESSLQFALNGAEILSGFAVLLCVILITSLTYQPRAKAWDRFNQKHKL